MSGNNESSQASALHLLGRADRDSQVVVCLGATAAQALISPTFKVTLQRGKLIPSPLAPDVMATAHPSSILRARDEATRERERKMFVDDLRAVAKVMCGLD